MEYATLEDLARWLGLFDALGEPDPTQLPPQATERMLSRASAQIQRATVTSVYNADEAGLPEDDDIVDAFRDATCAQVEAWLESGDEHGTQPTPTSVKIGSVAISGAGAIALGGSRLPERARLVLRNAGLLPGHIRI